MKILFVISAIRNGGAERVLQALASGLGARGYECEVLYFEEDQGRYEIAAKKTFLDLYSRGGFKAKFEKFARIRAFVKGAKPDAIISFMDQTNINMIIATAFLPRVLIATEHVGHDLLKSRFWRAARDFSYRFASGLTVLNREDYEYYDFVKNREIIHNPCFLPAPSATSAKEKIILSVGRLEIVKGYENYFRALALVPRESLEGWRVLIAGEGSEETALKALAKELNLNIEFVGHADVAALYEKAAVLVLPSLSEAFGNVLVESAAFGLARLATPTAGAKELIKDGYDGIICDFEPSSMASNLNRLLVDEKLRRELALRAKERESEFENSHIIDKWEKFIQKCKN